MEEQLKLGTLFTGRVDATFRRAVSQLRSIMQSLGQVQAKYSQGVSGVTSQTQKATKQQKAFGDAIVSTRGQVSMTSDALIRLKRAFQVITSFGIAGSAIYGFITALKTGVKEIVDYDQALKNVKAITGATAAQIRAMGQVLEDVASKTKFSTTELAEGLVLLGQSGFSAEESIKALPGVADLAAGTLSEMRTITDLVTTSIRAFDLEAIETGRVVDIMANAINKSKLTVDKLNTAFNFVGAAAGQAGLSLEQTAAAMMVLANNGQRASTIGTGLRQVLARMMAPNRKIREEFEALGAEISGINPKLHGFEKALQNLVPILYDFEKQTVDMGKAYELFGLRGAQAMAVLAKSFHGGKGSFQDMLNKTYEVGTSSEMAAEQAEGLAFKLKNLQDLAKLLALAFGDGGVKGIMVVFIDTLRTVTKAITALAQTIGGQAVLQFTLWTAAIGGTMKAIKFLMGTGLATWFRVIYVNLRDMALGATYFNLQLTRTAAISATIKTIWAGLKAHPFLLIASAVAAVGIAVQKLATRSSRLIKELKEADVVLQGDIQSLRVYQESLAEVFEKIKNGEDVTREYSALTKRLKADHEDLNDTVNILTASYEELNFAMTKMLSKKREERIQTLLGIMSESIGRGRTATKLKEYQQAAGEIATIIAEDVYKGIVSIEDAELQIREMMKNFDLGYGYQRGVILKLHKEVENLQKRDEQQIKAFEAQIKKLPAAWQETYDRLDDRGKVHLINQKKLVEQRIASLKKESAAILKSEYENEEARQNALKRMESEIWQEGLEEFLQKESKKEEAQDQTLKTIEDRYKRELELAQELGKQAVAEQKEKEKRWEEQRKREIKGYTDYAEKMLEAETKFKEERGKEYLSFQEEREKREIEWLNTHLENMKRAGATEIERERYKADWMVKNAKTTSAGVQKWKANLMTMKELAAYIGEELPEKITSGITSAMFDFAEGTKSAKEAFADFAKSTLRWLGEIIVRQQILNALTRGTGDTKKGIMGSIIGGISTMLAHTGGVIGKDKFPTQTISYVPQFIPSFHTGFGSDEFLAKLKKDETVFTPGQLNALGKSVGGGTKVDGVYNDFRGAYFQDRATLQQALAVIAAQTARQVTPAAWRDAYYNDTEIRDIVRKRP